MRVNANHKIWNASPFVENHLLIHHRVFYTRYTHYDKKKDWKKKTPIVWDSKLYRLSMHIFVFTFISRAYM